MPALWDKHRNTIVAYKSAHTIRMFNAAFVEIGATPGDYFPKAEQAQIDAVNARIHDTVNNGV